jgi:nicotinamidase-related amidase
VTVDALLVVDMQEGMLAGDAKHELRAVVARINRLAARVRKRGGSVFFIQHDGPPGEDFAPHSPGWPILGALGREPADRVVHKTLNSAFVGTSLSDDLTGLGVARVLIAGWATDFCVDATVRSAAELGFRVVVVSDGHTLSDRPHLNAPRIIEHHHFVWSGLFAEPRVALIREADL